MFLITVAKIILFGFCMTPIAFAALATGIVFGCFLLGASRNPLEKDMLFSNAMIAFVLIESFIFTAVLIAIIVTIIL